MKGKGFLTFFFLMIFSVQAMALEVIMFSSKSCPYCKRFMNEVGNSYDREDMPLRIIYMDWYPSWLQMARAEKRIKPVRGTPTFVIWDGEKELARIVGYPGKTSFFRKLDKFKKKYGEKSQ